MYNCYIKVEALIFHRSVKLIFSLISSQRSPIYISSTYQKKIESLSNNKNSFYWIIPILNSDHQYLPFPGISQAIGLTDHSLGHSPQVKTTIVQWIRLKA